MGPKIGPIFGLLGLLACEVAACEIMLKIFFTIFRNLMANKVCPFMSFVIFSLSMVLWQKNMEQSIELLIIALFTILHKLNMLKRMHNVRN